ncbi:LytTR family DNA-binding domain-containing protein [Mucilaginibacter sp. BT774]|uniref:LytR/AlgR family response regulator transcription factor n=1 Tax=Mucilaginibacter sp. BT774 TaxID=3062276 RepID=UPI002676ED8D|nr:LytTR family DNA-binding domain-containing protein [Mucilaginibacter sp. BT774]MDO3628559.1 LytTR family DNA-binding domain-containing protein [Mucilaginibacter sp. BT774]
MDDDETAMSLTRDFINKTPFLNLLSFYNNPLNALSALGNDDLQLVFLDVNMPGLNGIELAQIINGQKKTHRPHIIFISGYERYAIDGYKVNAIDYLLKPVDYEDFARAAFKAKVIIEDASKRVKDTNYIADDFLFLRVEYELIKVYLKNILYIEGFKDYVKIYSTNVNGYIKSLITMKNLEEKLPLHSFIRIHRSFIVSLDKIDSITTNMIRIGKTTIPISPQYKENFKKHVDQWF